MTSPVYWLLFAVAIVTVRALYTAMTGEWRRTQRLLQVQYDRNQRQAEDHYWNVCRLDEFTAAILITARAHPERIEELVS